jgi:p24 family protein beta-1
MWCPSFGLVAAASSLISLAAAHNIQMKAYMRECFHEQLHKDDKMTVTFQVGDREFGGSGNLEIDFWVRQLDLSCVVWQPDWLFSQIETPSRNFQVHERGVSSGDHTFIAPEDGKYVYCFNNEHWGANTKEVSFNVHGIVYVPESEAPKDPLENEGM